jgi:hypothetical protein
LKAPLSPSTATSARGGGAAQQDLGNVAQLLQRFGEDDARAFDLGAHQGVIARHGAGMRRGGFARRAGLAGVQQDDALARSMDGAGGGEKGCGLRNCSTIIATTCVWGSLTSQSM